MKKYILIVEELAKKLGFTGEVNKSNVKEIVVSLAENHAGELESQLCKMYDFAVRQWSFGNDSTISPAGRKAFTDNYDIITQNADCILAHLGIITDYPGLYPSFTIKIDGREYSESSVKNAIRRFNHFWK